MTNTEIARVAIQLNPSVREFFKMVNFHPIPEEAKYIAFFENGESCFLTDIETYGIGLNLPKPLTIITTYTANVEVELDD